MSRQLTPTDIDNFLYGATFFASGGGGGFYVTQSFAEKVKEKMKSQTLYLYDMSEITAAEMGVVTGAVGSPDKLQSEGVGVAPQNAVNLLQEYYTKQPFSYLMSVEIGANTLIAMLAAMEMNLKIVDCDGCGRAVPTLSNLTYSNTAGVGINPFTLANYSESGASSATVSLSTPSIASTSSLIRSIISTDQFSGGIAGLASWAMTGTLLNTYGTAVPQSIQLAINVGVSIQSWRSSYPPGANLIKGILSSLNSNGYTSSALAFHGVVSEVSESTSGGFDWGKVALKGIGDFDGVEMEIQNQNENIIAWRSDQSAPAIIFPDLITYMNREGTPLTNTSNDGIKEGLELFIIASKANPLMFGQNMLNGNASTLANVGYYGKYSTFAYPTEQLEKISPKNKIG